MGLTSNLYCLQFFRIDALSDKVISTYTGRLERIQDNPRWMDKSYSLFVRLSFLMLLVVMMIDVAKSFSPSADILSTCYLLCRLKIHLRNLIMLLEQSVPLSSKILSMPSATRAISLFLMRMRLLTEMDYCHCFAHLMFDQNLVEEPVPAVIQIP